jgi:hypothetical protein
VVEGTGLENTSAACATDVEPKSEAPTWRKNTGGLGFRLSAEQEQAGLCQPAAALVGLTVWTMPRWSAPMRSLIPKYHRTS